MTKRAVSLKPYAVKERVRARDGNKCTRCGFSQEDHITVYGKILHVHRLVSGSPYTEEGCVTLCYQCHSLADSTGRRKGIVAFHTDPNKRGRSYIKVGV